VLCVVCVCCALRFPCELHPVSCTLSVRQPPAPCELHPVSPPATSPPSAPPVQPPAPPQLLPSSDRLYLQSGSSPGSSSQNTAVTSAVASAVTSSAVTSVAEAAVEAAAAVTHVAYPMHALCMPQERQGQRQRHPLRDIPCAYPVHVRGGGSGSGQFSGSVHGSAVQFTVGQRKQH